MRYYALVLSMAAAACAQTTTTYNYDVNGHRVEAVGTVNHTTVVRDANGRRVPVQKVEERVISDDGRTRVVERVVRQYSTDGQPAAPEKVRIEETKSPDGSVTTSTTVWRGDLNGSMQLAQRATAQARTSGGITTETTAVEKPTLNGSMELVERQEKTTRTAPNAVKEDLTVYRKDANGRFDEAARSTVEKTTQNGTTVENAANFELGKLVKQSVTRTQKQGDNERVEQDVFVADAAGRVGSQSEARPQLKERRLVDRTFTQSGSKETVMVQRPLPSDPGRLSNPQTVEETICTGKCGEGRK